MSCSRWNESDFVKYCQNDFGATDLKEFEAHLAKCSECLERFTHCLKIITTECTPQEEQEIIELLNSQAWKDLKKELIRKYARVVKKRTSNGRVMLKVAAMLLLMLTPVVLTYRMLLKPHYEKKQETTERLAADSNSVSDLTDIAKTFEKANTRLKEDPNDLEALYERGVCFEQLLFLEQARNDFQRFLALSPDSPRELKVKNRLLALSSRIDQPSPVQTRYDLLESAIDDYLSATISSNKTVADDFLRTAEKIAAEMATLTGERFGLDLVSFYRTVPAHSVEQFIKARKLYKEARETIKLNDYTQGLEIASKAKTAFDRLDSNLEIEKTEILIGKSLVKLSRSKEAEKILKKGGIKAAITNHLYSHAQFLGWLGENYSNISNYTHAVEILEQAIQVVRPLDVPEFSNSLSMLLSSIYSVTNDNERAFLMAHKTLEEAIRTNHPFSIQVIDVLGLSAFNLGFPALAENYLKKAIELASNQQKFPHIAMANTYLGIIMAEQRKDNEAEQSFQKAFQSLYKIEDKTIRIQLEFMVTGYHARAQMLTGNSKQAVDLYTKALTLGEKGKIEEKIILSQMRQGLGECLAALGNYKGAESEFRAALSLRQSAQTIEQNNSLLSFSVTNKSLEEQIRLLETAREN
jgi:tetratricopeptide (TPR) repeat protein